MLASSLNETSILVSSHLGMCELTIDVYENDSFVKITPGYDITDHGWITAKIHDITPPVELRDV